jgi:hypothetical protein
MRRYPNDLEFLFRDVTKSDPQASIRAIAVSLNTSTETVAKICPGLVADYEEARKRLRGGYKKT